MSLDALCRRWGIDNSGRTLHGALLDSELLAEVYLELRGGKERVLDLSGARAGGASAVVAATAYPPRPRPLAPLSTPAERAAHIEFLRAVLSDHSLWAAQGVQVVQEDAAA